jgi:hypothetical protein
VTRRWWMAAAVLAVSIAAEIAFHDASHSLYWWHDVPGFDFVFGAAGCAAIVVVSKAIGSVWLQRPEPDGGGADEP